MDQPGQAPFAEARDPALGAALGAALDGRAPEAFVARLREAVRHHREDSLDVLARWAPWGMAAAAAAALTLWGAMAPGGTPPEAITASAPVHMEAAPQRSEGEVLAVILLEDR